MLGDGKLLARAPDWGFLHSRATPSMIMSYIKLALQVLRSIFFTKLLAPLGVVLSVFIVVVFAWYWFNRWLEIRSRRRWKLTEFQHPLPFTAGDIVSKIRTENLIGMGGSGNVYRVCYIPGHGLVRRIHWYWRLSPLDFGRFGSRRPRSRSRSEMPDFIGRRCSAATGHRSTVVAVKELKKTKTKKQQDKNLDKQFDAEVKTLGSIRHRNIITLLCCITSICTSLLVYEDMQNGSLDQWLHKPRGRLDWQSRVGIATDAARGLSYMHDQGIIHRDIKSSNILLDRDFGAKIGDFGLARLLAKPGESEPASAVCGTPGHIAPEYLRDAEVSEKVDVYSFGVVLLELITGQKPHNAGTEPGVGLARWASQQYMKKVRWARIIDEDIQNSAFLEDMKAVFKLGLSCTSEHPLDRPTMNEVLHQLLLCDPRRVNHRGKKRTLDVGRNIRDKILRRG